MKGLKTNRRNRSTKQKVKSTRRKRIWDLLRHIPTFMIRFLRLVAFVVFLLPAFVVFVWHYLRCDRIAAYYGDRQCYGNDETNESDNERDGTNSAPCEKIDVCDGVTNREKTQKCGDPFFSRHYLDIYGSRTPLPNKTSSGMATNKKPCVIFLTGGAWIIGYRMWGTLLGRALAPFGVLCIVPDYRNFPRVNIEGMVQDIDISVQWVLDHVEEYGGDKQKVVLVGQSAGAHIGGVVVALKVWDWLRKERSAKESSMKCEGPVMDDTHNESDVEMSPLRSTYSPQQLCGFISTSSPHNLVTMRPVLHRHGLSASVQRSIFGGLGDDQCNMEEEEDVFEKWSPFHIMLKAQMEYVKLLELDNGQISDDRKLQLKDIIPRFCVIHGTADDTVPISEAIEFISLLSKLHIPTEIKLYEGWSHTDPILEAPMCGDHTYHRDIYEMVRIWTGRKSCSYADEKKRGQSHLSEPFDEKHCKLRPICPSMLVEAARFCNPF
eukprot:CAMPEP_0172547896 /NCGR_PEP_ID=MMETSP1067-20121228/17323_1 /TAXON_ID=265564 ORGANISM="Thalassiosira punctigera, Strain Tpunct2005C2" /NCGR_SAMPLE_ID=MMETSP1067 /ASSEMBLY_ACC=CAM_ASM_000444 /LENGTH=491 /DNA_ID=CAMNT_0013335047 /DNA_START=164 /DNA_END=1639 /DNA_ORIENTATION=-